MTVANTKLQNEQVAFPLIARILRTVPDENAFYFYKEIGYYLDAKARSLGEFLSELKTIDIASIEFHEQRGDFENWFLTTLGDATLTKEAHLCKAKKGEELRNSLSAFVSARLTRLQKFH
ncbi:MAG: hypothetical protein PXY39_03670 [archaeon]|nr:hypothetical protein [archaeon]